MKERIGHVLADFLEEEVDYQLGLSTTEAVLTTFCQIVWLLITVCIPRAFCIVLIAGLTLAFLESTCSFISSPHNSDEAADLTCPLIVACLVAAFSLGSYDNRMLFFAILILGMLADLAGFLVARYVSYQSSILAQIFTPVILAGGGFFFKYTTQDVILLLGTGLFTFCGQCYVRTFENSLSLQYSNEFCTRESRSSDICDCMLKSLNPNHWLGLTLHGPGGYLDRLGGFIFAYCIALLVKTFLF